VTRPVFYQRPITEGRPLGVPPALASWDKAGSAGRQRLSAFLTEARSALAEPLRTTPDPLTFRLDIGLPAATPLLAFHDLDNYLFPLVPKLTERRFVSVWATKRHAATSTIGISRAAESPDPGGSCSFQVRTSASASTAAFKEQIRDQIALGEPLPPGGVALELAFVVGPRRAWANLWKATIDSLGPILGREPGNQQWNIKDGRIVDLGLHCVVDPHIGNEVVIAIRAAPDERA
jgi:hypothetical protein